jgi:hypothetical protein
MSLRSLVFACVPLTALALTGCDVDVNDPGAPPEVNVEGGRAPDVDVTPPDVDVHTEQRDVTVPDVDVNVEPERTRVDVPNVDINVPSERENEPGRQ